MSHTKYDPVLTEMHRIKDSISAEFNHDVGALIDHLRKLDVQAIVNGSHVVKAPAKIAPKPARKTVKKKQTGGRKTLAPSS